MSDTGINSNIHQVLVDFTPVFKGLNHRLQEKSLSKRQRNRLRDLLMKLANDLEDYDLQIAKSIIEEKLPYPLHELNEKLITISNRIDQEIDDESDHTILNKISEALFAEKSKVIARIKQRK